MYETFFGLSDRPFMNQPDPDYLYWTENHELAFTMLNYGIATKSPLTVVTGEIGAGKTTLLRHLLRQVPENLVVGLVSNMQADRGQLLHWAMMSLGARLTDEPYVMLFQRFQDFLIESYAGGRSVVLIFDEAQNLSVSQLEELRMLSNINADKDQLLQLVLVGQPQLRGLLMRPELTQFAQRVSADFHLTAMKDQEVRSYIEHRLQVAGASWRIFSEETCRLIHGLTGGVPRLVNILCDMCLIYAFAADEKVVSSELVREFVESSRRRGIFGQFRTPLEASLNLHTAS